MAEFKESEQLTEQMRLSGSIDYALDQAKMRIEQDKQSLKPLPVTDAKEALLGVADRVIADIS